MSHVDVLFVWIRYIHTLFHSLVVITSDVVRT